MKDENGWAVIFLVGSLATLGYAAWIGVTESFKHFTMFDLYLWIAMAVIFLIARNRKESQPGFYGLSWVVLAILGFVSTFHHGAERGTLTFAFGLIFDALIFIFGVRIIQRNA